MFLGELLGPERHRRLLGYGTVHFGKSLLWAGEDALAIFVMVQFLALSPAVVGALFFASALWNAVCDGLFGIAMSRWSWLGRHMPALCMVAIAASGISFALLPLVPVGNLLLAGTLLFVFRTGFSLADVAHNGLTARLTGRLGHLRVAQLRAVGSALAALIVAALSVVLLGARQEAVAAATRMVPVIGLFATMLMLPLPWLLAGNTGLPAKTSRIIPEIAGTEFWTYCLATAIGVAGLAAMGKAVLHIDFDRAGIGTAALLLLTVGRLSAVWLWTPFARVFGNRFALALSYVATGASALMIPLLAKAQGAGPVLLLTAAGICGGGTAFLSWSMLTRVLDSHGDKNREPELQGYVAAFGFFTMTTKAGLGLSGVMVGLWLSTNRSIGTGYAGSFWPLAVMCFAASLAAAALIALPQARSMRTSPAG